MIHDTALLDQLASFPIEGYSGTVYRATRQTLDPLVSSTNGGRWMPKGIANVLYTSLVRDGALAEIAFHWSQLDPMPSKPVQLHTLEVVAQRTLRLVRADLRSIGVSDNEYATVNPARTQEIGAAVEFLGCDGLIAPSARWECDHLILFPDRFGARAVIEAVGSETIDWIDWAKRNGLMEK